MRLTLTITLLAAVLAFPASAGMYKWKDADGKTRYGQFPPAGVSATPMKAKPAPHSATTRKPLQDQVKALDKQLEERETTKTEAAAKKQNAAIRKQNCENARNNITQLGYGGNRLVHMPDGSYARLSEKEKQEKIKKNKDAIKKFCD